MKILYYSGFSREKEPKGYVSYICYIHTQTHTHTQKYNRIIYNPVLFFNWRPINKLITSGNTIQTQYPATWEFWGRHKL